MPRTKKTEAEPASEKVNIRGLGQLKKRYGSVWYVSFSVNGQQYRESTHCEKYNDAVAFLKRRVTEVQTGTFVSVNVDKTTVADILREVAADYTVKKRALTTFLMPSLNLHLLPYFNAGTKVLVRDGSVTLEDVPGKKVAMRASRVTQTHLRNYVAHRQGEGASDATINRELSLLRRAYTLGVAAKLVNAGNIPSFKEVRLKEMNARQGFWEYTDYLKYRDSLPGYARGPFVMAYWTGMRFGEIVSLEWEQVDFAQRVVRLRDDQTKGKEPRIIPIGKSGLTDLYDTLVAQKELRDQLCPSSPWVFFHTLPKFRGENIGSLKAIWLKVAIAVGMAREATTRTGKQVMKAEKMFHDLRRTGVRNLVRAGVPEKVAMRISGHKTRSVFERYNIVDETDLHDAMDKLGRYVATKAVGV